MFQTGTEARIQGPVVKRSNAALLSQMNADCFDSVRLPPISAQDDRARKSSDRYTYFDAERRSLAVGFQ